MEKSNKALEAFEAKQRRMNRSEWEICNILVDRWPKFCPNDPAKHLFEGLTFRTRVIYKQQYVWADEFPSITEKTAVRLFRRISDQYSIDGLSKAIFRVNNEELL